MGDFIALLLESLFGDALPERFVSRFLAFVLFFAAAVFAGCSVYSGFAVFTSRMAPIALVGCVALAGLSAYSFQLGRELLRRSRKARRAR